MDLSGALSALTGTASAPPTLRKPACVVKFGGVGAGGGDGGLAGALGDAVGGGAGGALAAAGSALGLGGGGGAEDPWKVSLVSVTVETGLAPFVDAAEIELAAGERAPKVSVGDTGTVSLGYEDTPPELVFTGQVSQVRHTASGMLRVTAVNGGASLAQLRVNQSYEQQAAGEIASDLVGRVQVETDTVEDGVNFPFYVVDDRRNTYVHIATLARQSGFIAFMTPEGKMNLAPFTEGQSIQTFTFGDDILEFEVSEGTAPVGKATTIGEGAATSEGQEAWSWLLKDSAPVQATAGKGEPELQFQDRALRTGDAAQTAATGISNAASRLLVTGRLLAPGAPAVAVGRAIEIKGAPQANVNGIYMVRGLRHHFNKRTGFTSQILFTKTGDSAGASDGLLGLVGGLL